MVPILNAIWKLFTIQRFSLLKRESDKISVMKYLVMFSIALKILIFICSFSQLSSKFHDGAVSVKRAFVNNFLDGSKQEAIDILLLGNTFIGRIGERARALLSTSFLHCEYTQLMLDHLMQS